MGMEHTQKSYNTEGGEALQVKYWLSEDGQSSLGYWPIDTPDEDIYAELLDQCGSEKQRTAIRAGSIKIDTPG
jgi:hypothetical protein